MAGAELLFEAPYPAPADLLFGGVATEEPDRVDLSITGSFAPLTVSASFLAIVDVQITGSFAPLTVSARLEYRSNTARPFVLQTMSSASAHEKLQQGAAAAHQEASALPAGTSSSHQYGVHVAASVGARTPGNLQPGRSAWFVRHQRATAEHDGAAFAHQEASRALRPDLASSFEAATGLQESTRFGHQDGTRTHSHARVRHENARGLVARVSSAHQPGTPLIKGWHAEHEAAMQPIPGITLPPVKPADPPPFTCYTPNGELVFAVRWVGGGELVFMCGDGTVPPPPPGPGGPIIIPVRRAYLVINNVFLRRVDDSTRLHTPTLRISIDRDSWTYSWSASLSIKDRDAVMSDSSGAPVLVEASVNGQLFRLVVDSVVRDRTHPSKRVNVSGRGWSALLGDEEAISRTYGNEEARTAVQLMNEALTVNGVSLGWAVDAQITDWLVPAGVWSHQGTPMSALTTIAASVGGYVQPNPTGMTVRVLPAFAVKPWELSSATPDVVLPSAAVEQEGIEWVRRPAFNRVFVSGQKDGRRGQVTLAGAAGDVLAPPVVDSLITHVDAARQRGVAELGKGGNMVKAALRLQVLPETGVIHPGKVLEYVVGTGAEAETYRGYVRGVAVDYTFPKLRQALAVDAYEMESA